jgi:hypothetical protein
VKTARAIALMTVRLAALVGGIWCILPLEAQYPLRGMLAVFCFVVFATIRERPVDVSDRAD